jgi:hypothetical protein
MILHFKIICLLAIGSAIFGFQGCQRKSSEIDPPAKGGCTEEDVRLAIHPNNHDFSKQMDKCASKVWGNAKKTTQCLKKHYPALSQSCADCFGEIASCSASHCKLACIGNHFSDKCLECVNTNCREMKKDDSFSLIQCTGLPANQLPPGK